MTPVIAFGEALVDMLSSRLGDASGPETFTPYAGGAPANVAVACARLGVPSRFLGMVGADRFGRFLTTEMASHGVDVSGVVTTFDARTALAFVSRDAHGERTFDFYRPPAADLLYRLEHLPTGVFAEPAIVHLCSNSLTEETIAETTLALADIAQRSGSLVSVDANLRANLWPDGQVDIARVTALLDRAQLVKLSADEVEALRGDHPVDAWISQRLAAGVRLVVITDGAEPVSVQRLGQRFEIVPPAVRAIDTTAGGDAFIGGLLAMLAEADVDAAGFAEWCDDSEGLKRAVRIACRCGAHAVTQPGAYAALPAREDLERLKH
ncbi:carbohydrate kinase family protein [Modicisalibacter zincidurans]|uniref:Carbohydrate kinase n=1 Tax=Modicisalibacter zincidurans TaxID=1178777 RepID=A0ABP9R898_9GAMM|nr:carbohydrate kinase [Halomonas zincidurans]MEA3252644.1 carbohydrate kinase [Pseudomonadota bacterium]